MSSRSSFLARYNRSSVTTWILLGLLLPCALGSLSACNILIPVSYAIDGQGQVDAEHEFEPIKTLVFVDDSLNILPRQVLKVRLAEAISNDLVIRELIPNAVNPGDAMAMVRSRDRSGQHMSMQSIAREAGVKQMLFIEVESFESTVRNTQMRPSASCSLRVMHFDKGGRVYPETSLNVGGQCGRSDRGGPAPRGRSGKGLLPLRSSQGRTGTHRKNWRSPS